MLIAVHQPNFFPWIGYFYKMAHADLFVLYDDAQFTRGGYINRSLLKTSRGKEWLSIPVATTGHYLQKICDTQINAGPWRKKVIGKLSDAYRDARYFDYYMERIKVILNIECDQLNDLNTRLLTFVRAELKIDTPLVLASQCKNITGASTERLISICRSLGANAYLSGFGGRNYQDDAMFKEAGIELEYSDLVHPTYPQLWGAFTPGLSVVDLLFNEGPESYRFFQPEQPALSPMVGVKA